MVPQSAEMSKRLLVQRRAACLFLGGALFALAACEPGGLGSDLMYFPPIRYRLTATVETPEGERTGSSVIETNLDRGLTGADVRGEAVAVDLPDGEVLFVLLRSPGNVDWAAGLPGIPMPEEDVPVQTKAERVAQVERQLAHVTRERQLYYLHGGPPEQRGPGEMPYLVHFADLSDPASVQQVNPDDLAASFGQGYRLKSLTVQITDEPVTTGIGERLGWLEKYRAENRRINGSNSAAIATNDLSDNIGTGSFSTGIPR